MATTNEGTDESIIRSVSVIVRGILSVETATAHLSGRYLPGGIAVVDPPAVGVGIYAVKRLAPNDEIVDDAAIGHLIATCDRAVIFEVRAIAGFTVRASTFETALVVDTRSIGVARLPFIA